MIIARAFIAACMAGCALVGSAMAQADPVMTNYQVYSAAMERGDLAAAETAGAAALQASQARDGEGGATAGLAANLAQVRLDQDKLEDAREPARLAFAISQRRGGASGVNPVYAQLLLAHANLATRGGPEAMHAALAAAQGELGMSGQTYRAALKFGDWGLRQDIPLDAARAYDVAVALAIGDSASDQVARAEALVGRGIARAMADRAASGRVLTGTRLANRPDERADLDFKEALRITRPIAEREARLRGYARSQVVFGAALAWAHARRIMMNALGWQDPYRPEEMRSLVVDLNAEDGLPACPVNAVTNPPPDYPSEEVDRHGASALVARFVTDAGGAITDAKLVGSSGASDLVRATMEVLPRWRVSAGASGCSNARVIFLPVHIVIDDTQNSERLSSGRGPERTWIRRQDRGIVALPRD